MATFKVIVQKQRNDGFWPVYIRITHNRGVKYIRTDKIVDSKGVDKKNREVKDPLSFSLVQQESQSLQSC